MLITEMSSPAARAASQGMAVCTIGNRNHQAIVVVYDPNLLLGYLRQKRSLEDRKTVIEDSVGLDPVVRAGVTYYKSSDPRCHDNGIVGKAASVTGSGMGPAAYEAAMWYAGGLASDREETSRRAGRVWSVYKNRADAGDLDALPFDDVEDPQTLPDVDDCGIQDREWLNYSYRLPAKPAGLDIMEKNHEAIKPKLKRLGFPDDTLEWKLKMLFMMIFDERMWEDDI